MGNLKIKGQQDRSKINMHEPHEVQCWIKHLKVSQEQLQKAMDKVGNGAAAVRKELAAEAVKGWTRKSLDSPSANHLEGAGIFAVRSSGEASATGKCPSQR